MPDNAPERIDVDFKSYDENVGAIITTPLGGPTDSRSLVLRTGITPEAYTLDIFTDIVEDATQAVDELIEFLKSVIEIIDTEGFREHIKEGLVPSVAPEGATDER